MSAYMTNLDHLHCTWITAESFQQITA